MGDLQQNMIDAWRQKTQAAGKIIEAHLRGFATQEAAEKANIDFQLAQLHMGYWMQFGHKSDVGGGE